ncbi:FecCD family ABC transporter permease [Romboutsia lituseburensis]|uniref:Iron complex transport system permease protein n=1 Tax=Romboutsia lituseburensis DSM 797 TaxID=1121325 RepID=A0A1G9MM27_9FIRM|nr:iron ABC transporter permease [Romboutsia lituseburensis]CEH34410.1 Hemin transport system permease protein HmuU [Romboutsia lituseburensis]SDL74957.1 iron complex transport system permease protein [Romboutsia lituseburensis DSM 797]
MNKSYIKSSILGISISTLLIITMLVAMGIGRYSISIGDIINVLLPDSLSSGNIDPNVKKVIYNIRLPRVLIAALAGSGLAISGAAFQSLFSNPLATPDTLGVATGASFGAALGIILGFDSIGVQSCAFIAGIACIGLVYAISKVKGERPMIMIILAGMVISSLFQAMVSLLKYVADPQDTLPQITFWLMGSLSGVGFEELILGSPFIIIGIVIIFLLRWKMNMLSLHEDESKSLGVNVKVVRLFTIMSAALITASVVSICGNVGWVGLLIPHISRMIFGNNNKSVIPASIGLGAIFMIIIDTIARSATAAEIPISILTAVVGAPFFIILLRKTGGIH